MRCRRSRGYVALFLILACVVGESACDQKANRSEQGEKASDRAKTETPASGPVHPSVPGRTVPCPREGGMDKSGYPCEPTPPSKGLPDK
jgi:hypothetical protein